MLNVLTKFNGSVRKCVRTFSDAVCNMMRYDVIYRYDVMGAFVFFPPFCFQKGVLFNTSLCSALAL